MIKLSKVDFPSHTIINGYNLLQNGKLQGRKSSCRIRSVWEDCTGKPNTSSYLYNYINHCNVRWKLSSTILGTLSRGSERVDSSSKNTILLPRLFERRKSTHPSQQIIHTSRANPVLLRYCDEKNVIIVCLPSHTAHRLQPLYCGPNGLLKRKLSFYITEDIRLFSHKPIICQK